MDKKQVGLTSHQAELRKQMQKLSTVLCTGLSDTKSRFFGEVATIIEASIPEPARAKAVKDLVSNAIYGGTFRNMDNIIDFQLKQLCEANGFELYNAPEEGTMLVTSNEYTTIK